MALSANAPMNSTEAKMNTPTVMTENKSVFIGPFPIFLNDLILVSIEVPIDECLVQCHVPDPWNEAHWSQLQRYGRANAIGSVMCHGIISIIF